MYGTAAKQTHRIVAAVHKRTKPSVQGKFSGFLVVLTLKSPVPKLGVRTQWSQLHLKEEKAVSGPRECGKKQKDTNSKG